MYYQPATAFFAIASAITLTAALPSTQNSARTETDCGLSMKYDQSSNNIDLTLMNQPYMSKPLPDSAVLGRAQTTGGTKKFNFDSAKKNVLVLKNIYTRSQLSPGDGEGASITWNYGKHSGTWEGSDVMDCEGDGQGADPKDRYTCVLNFNCGD
jgi:hypothetical protein